MLRQFLLSLLSNWFSFHFFFTMYVTYVCFSFVLAFGSELRCHCNLQSCAKSNSMCKTVLGCFQELPSISQRELRHGCLELWPSKRPYQCAADVVGGGEDEIVVQKIYSPPAESTIKKESHYHNQNRHANHNQRRHNTIAFRCCLQDMCNFVDVDRTNAENRLHTLELNILPLNVNSGKNNFSIKSFCFFTCSLYLLLCFTAIYFHLF